MQLNLLFLPLLGGFVFYVKWNVTRYQAARCLGQRLLFTSAAFGLLLLIVARLVVIGTSAVLDIQAQAINLMSYLLLGTLATVVTALVWIAYEASREPELREELGTEKPAAGVLIAAATAVEFWLVLSRIQGSADALLTTLLVVRYSSLMIFLAAGGTLALRWTFKKYGEELFIRFREGAVLLRVSLLILLALQVLQIVLYTADIADELWRGFSPYPDSGTAFLACMIGVIAWKALNLLFPYQVANAKLHRDKRTNSLERLLYFAALEPSLIQLTLRDGKVYVGWIVDLPPDPASSDAYLNFLPSASGYRDGKTKKVTFTTSYVEIYESEEVDAEEEFTKVIPISNIESAGRFREDVYLRFQKAGPQAAALPFEDDGG
jgi:hypothetical protein